MVAKICTKCGIEKDILEFSPNKSRCKKCRSEDSKVYYYAHSEQISEYWKRHHEEHKEEDNLRSSRWREDHPKEVLKYREDHRQYYRDYNQEYWSTVQKFGELTLEQKDNNNKYQREWRRAQGPEYRQLQNDLQNQRRAENPQVKIATSLRTRLKKLLKKDWKAGSGVRDLGCSVEECKSYLESKFQLGMMWSNYGSGPGKWNIDHVIPLSAFDLTDRQHVVLACHYMNLQPLWFEENMSKSDTYPEFNQDGSIKIAWRRRQKWA